MNHYFSCSGIWSFGIQEFSYQHSLIPPNVKILNKPIDARASLHVSQLATSAHTHSKAEERHNLILNLKFNVI
jgi:hypothetical protein